MIAFGPVPSRRLGRSVGINNIPPKICSYSCVYCQLGRTPKKKIERCSFYRPEDIIFASEEKVKTVINAGEDIDYLTFVPDGEPTLDSNLGLEIEMLKKLDIKIAVITNASLLSRDDVRNDLMGADWVSLKIDAGEEKTWHKINRPHHRLRFLDIVEGILTFAENYSGFLATETMLVRDLNDSKKTLSDVASLLSEIKPALAYISIPIRPPAESWVRPPKAHAIASAYQILCNMVPHVEVLADYEGEFFAFTENLQEEILSITAVHPMREDALRKFLSRAGANWDIVQELIDCGKLLEKDYGGRKYFLNTAVEPNLSLNSNKLRSNTALRSNIHE
jgi:wyosine [tRNA(Phe)-imidazoG37] synthetase (radical SAM superfamily)